MSAIANAYGGQRLITVKELELMVAAGVFSEDEHIELIEGRLVPMVPQGPPHAGSTTRLARRVRARVAARWELREEKPLRVSDFDLPEPDIAVVPLDEATWDARHPLAAEATLVVEVACSSQRVDRAKATLYARGGVGEYWLLDVKDRRLTVHQGPEPEGTWRMVRVLSEAEEVEVPEALRRDDVDSRIPIAELLPAPDVPV